MTQLMPETILFGGETRFPVSAPDPFAATTLRHRADFGSAVEATEMLLVVLSQVTASNKEPFGRASREAALG